MQKRKQENLSVKDMADSVPIHLYIHCTRHRPSSNPSTLHYHSYPELGVCLSGRGIFYIHNNVYSFRAGDISIIYPGENHIAKSVSGELSDWWFLTIDDLALFEDWPQKEKLHQLASGGYGHILTTSENRQIAAALHRLIELYTPDTAILEERRGQIGALYACILYESANWQREDMEKGKGISAVFGSDRMIYPALEYMLAHYRKPVSTEQLCALCHMSPVHLRRIFISSIGISPIAFLHKIRISYACLALSDTKDSILSIAERSGYSSLSSFNRQFQKQMQMSPSQYRRNTSEY